MCITRNIEEIEQVYTWTVAGLSGKEPIFPEKSYLQGVLDILEFLLGEEENPFQRQEE